MKEEEEIQTYRKRIITEQGDGSERELVITDQAALSERFAYPAFQVEWTSGYNEDTAVHVGIAVLSDGYTYLYLFQTSIDALDEMRDEYLEVLGGLELVEV